MLEAAHKRLGEILPLPSWSAFWNRAVLPDQASSRAPPAAGTQHQGSRPSAGDAAAFNPEPEPRPPSAEKTSYSQALAGHATEEIIALLSSDDCIYDPARKLFSVHAIASSSANLHTAQPLHPKQAQAPAAGSVQGRSKTGRPGAEPDQALGRLGDEELQAYARLTGEQKA